MIGTVQLTSAQDLSLDPRNPRLGRENVAAQLSQEALLDFMRDNWNLEELAVSFLESGFWPQEPLVVTKEKIGRQECMLVVEGNRRLAALLMLNRAKAGKEKSEKWVEIAKSAPASAYRQLATVPYVLVSSREEVQAFLGFRHVTGIKEWHPAEKAQFIAHLIEDRQLSYREVMRKIGSKTPVVRRNYISYRLLLQMEDQEDVSIAAVEDRFSVLFLSLRTVGAQTFLGIDIEAAPSKAIKPVPKAKLKNLSDFALWLFGNEDREPLVTDSRQIEQFGEILASVEAVGYLRRAATPRFERAYSIAGGDEEEVAKRLERATDEIEIALQTVHLHRKSRRIIAAAIRLGKGAKQLVQSLPDEVAEGIEAE